MAEPKTTTTTPSSTAPATDLIGDDGPVKNSVDLDDISLAQALLDVDIANARVIDLTKRLTALTKELRETTSDLQKAKLRNRRIVAELEELKGSRAFRSASAAQRVLDATRSRLGR